jgi:UPF0755 protein
LYKASSGTFPKRFQAMAFSNRFLHPWLLFAFGFALGILILFGWPWLRAITQSNLETTDDAPIAVFLDQDDVLDSLLDKMRAEGARFHEADVRRVARLMEYGPGIKPGHYRIAPGQTTREWIVPLRLGRQDPINLTFTKFRTAKTLAAHLGERLSFTPQAMEALLGDSVLLAAYGLKPETALSAFLANTYSVWWYTTPEAFLKRMLEERERFWAQGDRPALADSLQQHLGLSTWDIQVLASIVMEEQAALQDEWQRIAGLYLNRIRKGWALESDPTIKFALGDFEARRVTFPMIDASADSPWNTYRNPGVPPGPLCTVSPKAIDAVLKAEQHPYMFMCAKADFSGYHAFARSNAEHNRNRARFIAEQNRRGIR